MKKIIISLNLTFILVLCSCLQTYKLTNFFTNKVLKDCFISDLPKPIESNNNIIANSKTDISFETTIDGFYSNVSYYEYLKNKNFNYFGIEGEVLNLKLLLIIKK